MNGKLAKKLRKYANIAVNESVNDFIDTVEKLSFFKRLELCWKILIKKL